MSSFSKAKNPIDIHTGTSIVNEALRFQFSGNDLDGVDPFIEKLAVLLSYKKLYLKSIINVL